MNEEEHQHALVQRLRSITYGWLQALRQSSTLRTPYANYPFPEEFPFSKTSLRATFRWNDFYGRELHHNFPIVFEFIRTSYIPEDPTTRLIWKITSCRFRVSRGFDRLTAFKNRIVNDNTILGFFEVDSRILFDRRPQLVLDTDLIVDCILESLRRGCPLELSSTIIPEPDSDRNSHVLERRNLEIFEIRTHGKDLVCELGRRWIPKRQCEACYCWIPPSGPQLCLMHIFQPAEG